LEALPLEPLEQAAISPFKWCHHLEQVGISLWINLAPTWLSKWLFYVQESKQHHLARFFPTACHLLGRQHPWCNRCSRAT